MEPVSLSIGIIALAGIFNDCIELFSLISTARDIGRDYKILEAKLDIEKTLLLQWSERISLFKQSYHASLSDARTCDSIRTLLIQIRALLNEGSILQERYGLKPNPEPADGYARKWIASISRQRMGKFINAFQEIGGDTASPTNTVHLPPLQRVRWVVKDKAKFEKLIEDLSYFVEKLTYVIPPSAGDALRMAEEDFDVNWRAEELQLVYDAAAGRKSEFASIARLQLDRKCEQKILDRLKYSKMEARKDSVSECYKNTMAWALDPFSEGQRWSSLSEWLMSGDGIYWLHGKAGSGKSTLMKFLCNHKRTLKYLSTWAEGDRCSTVSFFIWRLGSEEQKSLQGLFRSILYQVLLFDPSLCRELLPSIWEQVYGHDSYDFDLPTTAEMWTISRTIAACRCLSKTCLFIDGLDEFAGDYLEGISYIKCLASGPNLKIVVSSRPEPAFVGAFKRLPSLRLQDLTENDIRDYVEGTLGGQPYVQELEEVEPDEAASLVTEMVSKANGVFLWVIMACRSVLDGFAAYDHMSELRKRIDELPPELEDLFQHMLMKVDSRYRVQMAKILNVCHVSTTGDGIPTLGLALLDAHDMDTTNIPPSRHIPLSDKQAKCRFLEGRLRSRCGGLLEVHSHINSSYGGPGHSAVESCFCGKSDSEGHDGIVDSYVRFMHRTVAEFLDHEETWRLQCLQMGRNKFDPMAAVACISFHLARDWAWSPTRTATLRNSHLWVFASWKYATVANWEPSDQVLPVILEFEHLLKSDKYNEICAILDPSRSLSPTQILTCLAVEVAMVDVVECYRQRTLQDLATWTQMEGQPLLYHATNPIMHPRFEWHLSGDTEFVRVAPAHRMIRYLLSVGCDPNESFRSTYMNTTPWWSWLELVQMTPYDKDEEVETVLDKASVTAAYLEARGFELPGLNIIQDWVEKSMSTLARYPPSASKEAAEEELRAIIQLVQERQSGSSGAVVDAKGCPLM